MTRFLHEATFTPLQRSTSPSYPKPPQKLSRTQQYPYCDRRLTDMNGDGFVDNFDIDGFVAALVGP